MPSTMINAAVNAMKYDPREQRDPAWQEVRRQIETKIEQHHGELLTCDVDRVERVRGRIEALRALLELEHPIGGDYL